MATQIRRDLYADVTSRKRPAEAMQNPDWPTPTTGATDGRGKRSLPPTRYWVDAILTTAFDCRRFDCEREALAFGGSMPVCPTLNWFSRTRFSPKGGRSSSRGAAKQNEAPQSWRNEHDPSLQPRARTHTTRGQRHVQFETRLRQMVLWEARQAARQAVIRRIKAEGKVKVSLMSAGEISSLANAHLREHAKELLAAAEASRAVQRLVREEGNPPIRNVARLAWLVSALRGEPLPHGRGFHFARCRAAAVTPPI
jgi:hypothetical protein